MTSALPATSRPQTKRFKLVNTLVLPGQAETLTTRSPTFPLLMIAGLRTERVLEICVIGGTSQFCFIHALLVDMTL